MSPKRRGVRGPAPDRHGVARRYGWSRLIVGRGRRHALKSESHAMAGAGPPMSLLRLVCCTRKLALRARGTVGNPGGSGAPPGAESTREGPIEGASQ